MTPGGGITVAASIVPARQHDGTTASEIISPLARTSPEEVECTQAQSGTGQKGASSRTPATSDLAVTGITGDGLVPRSAEVARQLIIASACTGNMDEAVITGASTLRQATAVAGIPGAGDITAGADNAQIAKGEASIIDVATARPVVWIRSGLVSRPFTATNRSAFGPSGAPSIAAISLRRAAGRRWRPGSLRRA